MPEREEVEYYSEGTRISGWFFPATREEGPTPGLVFCPGFTGTKFAAFYEPYVERFVSEGYAVLLSDYRGWGESDGPRGILNPWWQVQDARNGLTYLETRAEVDPNRLGLFGVSFGGGIVSYTAGVDTRVKATVSVSGFGDGFEQLRSKRREYEWQEFLAEMAEDRRQRVLTGSGKMVEAQGYLSIPTPERRVTKVKGAVPEGMVPKETPLASADAIIDFRPLDVVDKISPRAIMWCYVDNDTAVTPQHSLAMHARAGDPKKLVRFHGTTHYGLYLGRFDQIAAESIGWYREHLDTPTTMLRPPEYLW